MFSFFYADRTLNVSCILHVMFVIQDLDDRNFYYSRRIVLISQTGIHSLVLL